jgi:sugar phosphate isomerase/epimerase
MAWPSRLSVNQYTATPRPFNELVEAAARAGVPALGLNRRMLEEFGFEKAAQLMRHAGIKVSSYTAAGYWASGHDASGRPRGQGDNIDTLDAAVSLGTDVVCVTSGGMAPGDRDIQSARLRAMAGLATLLPHAADRGLTLAIEGLHPIYCPQMSVWVNLEHVLDILEELNHPNLGIFLDTYHTWWDPRLPQLLERAKGKVALVQLNDWSAEMIANSDPYNRAMMGDGCIDYDVFAAGLKDYTGWYEAEVLNDRIQQIPLDGLLNQCQRGYEETMGRRLAALRS